MEIEIVQGRQEDIDELELLYNSVTDYLAANINYTGWSKGGYPTRREAEADISNGTMFVAKANNVIVGSVVLNHEPENGYDSVKWLTGNTDYSKIIVIHTLAVHQDYSHKGVGQALMDFTLRFAIGNGMKSIRLDVYEENLPAIKLYEKNNYTYIDTIDIGLRNCRKITWTKLF